MNAVASSILAKAVILWYERYRAVLVKLGFRPCAYDPCIYVRDTKDGEFTIAAVYVDDTVAATSKFEVQAELRKALEAEFKLTWEDNPEYLLNMACRALPGGGFHLSQHFVRGRARGAHAGR